MLLSVYEFMRCVLSEGEEIGLSVAVVNVEGEHCKNNNGRKRRAQWWGVGFGEREKRGWVWLAAGDEKKEILGLGFKEK